VYGNVFPDVETVACLLQKGADPNEKPPDRIASCWLRVLKTALTSSDGTHSLIEPWASIVYLMVEAGADLDELKSVSLPPMAESEKRLLSQELQKISPRKAFVRLTALYSVRDPHSEVRRDWISSLVGIWLTLRPKRQGSSGEKVPTAKLRR
jgi:hypothetical protein